MLLNQRGTGVGYSDGVGKPARGQRVRKEHEQDSGKSGVERTDPNVRLSRL